MRIRGCLFLLATSVYGANTTVAFQPSSSATGPFPSDILTAPASDQQTGLKINLPPPAGCSLLSSSTACVNNALINQLDGFSLTPRVRVCFSGPLDPSTLHAGISLYNLDRNAPPTLLNQILIEPVANCIDAKPDHVLDQQTRYLLTVTSRLTDAGGMAVQPDPAFTACLDEAEPGDYCRTLSKAVAKTVKAKAYGGGNVVAASLFTTMSATTWMEQARAQINKGIPAAGWLLGSPSVFNLTTEVQSITWNPQTSLTGFNGSQALPLDVLPGVERIAFGLFLSPFYLQLAGPQAGTIPNTPTKMPVASPGLVLPVSFHIFLPPAPLGKGKIPVIIYGHGLGDNQFGAPTFAASAWAKKGFATLAMEIPGHGFGPLGSVQVVTSRGSFTVLTPGRGIPFSATAPIGPTDGCILPNAIATRDCARQTAVDLITLVRAIRSTQGLGLNLDTSRIYYVGQSFGAMYGTVLEAVEPNVAAGTLNSGGGTQTDIARLSPIARQLGAAYLASFTPPLLNVVASTPQDSFNDEYVYRDQIVTHTVDGALAIQAAFEQAEWLGMSGDPLSFAPHLKTTPLAGVPAKSILLQYGRGDLEVPNPPENALARAGDLQASTWVLRTDFAAALDPRLPFLFQPGVPFPIYPHRFLSNPTIFAPQSPPLEGAIALAAQNQIADFFLSGGAVIPNPNLYLQGAYSGQTLFQKLSDHPEAVPEALNFLLPTP